MKTYPRFIAATLTCLMLVTGCGTVHDAIKSDSGERQGKKTMDITMQQAAEREDAMLDATLDAIKPPVHWTHSGTSKGENNVSRERTVMTIISEQRLGNFIGVVQRAWEAKGYRMTSVNKDKKFPAVYFQSSDGFGISLLVGDQRQVTITVDSPRVKHSDVAEPTASPNGPDYNYPVPRPNVHSDFWSSDKSIPTNTPSST